MIGPISSGKAVAPRVHLQLIRQQNSRNQLGSVRTRFGWSQEAMAAQLGVSVSTISKWERAYVPELNPFLRTVWATISRYSSRLYRYMHALLPPQYIASVRADTAERSLYIGPEAVVLAMSVQTKKLWGVYRYHEGISAAAFMDADSKKMMAAFYDVMNEICLTHDTSRVINFVTKDAPFGSTPPLWRIHHMRIVYPEVFDMVSYPITQEQYLTTEPKFWVSMEPRKEWPLAFTSLKTVEPQAH